MNSPLADAIQAAFRDCRDMDASLGERLDAFAASVRTISAPFAEAVDRLVGRLEKADAGAGRRVWASFCRRSTFPTSRAASSRSTRYWVMAQSPSWYTAATGARIAA